MGGRTLNLNAEMPDAAHCRHLEMIPDTIPDEMLLAGIARVFQYGGSITSHVAGEKPYRCEITEPGRVTR